MEMVLPVPLRRFRFRTRRSPHDAKAITEKGAIGFLKTLLEMSGSHCEAVRAKAGRFVTGTKSSQDVISTTINDLGFLDSPAMRDPLSGDGYDWQAFKNSVSTLAIIIPASKLQSHSGYTRLLISSALRELQSTGPSECVPPTALMLDETPTLGMLS
jgi:type IV secretion system protein VirD4